MSFFCGCLKLHRLIDSNKCWLMVLSLQTVSGIVRYLGFAGFQGFRCFAGCLLLIGASVTV